MFYRASIVLGICCGLSLSEAFAATLSGTLDVSATVISSCILNSASPILFPRYSSLDPRPDRTASIVVVTCSPQTPYSVGFDKGKSSAATTSNHLFEEGGGKFSYVLLRKPNTKEYWGDQVGSDTVSGVGTGFPQQLSVYGEIAPGQQIPYGHYSDTVRVILTF
jgi:spore coat protein U-like protein